MQENGFAGEVGEVLMQEKAAISSRPALLMDSPSPRLSTSKLFMNEESTLLGGMYGSLSKLPHLGADDVECNIRTHNGAFPNAPLLELRPRPWRCAGTLQSSLVRGRERVRRKRTRKIHAKISQMNPCEASIATVSRPSPTTGRRGAQLKPAGPSPQEKHDSLQQKVRQLIHDDAAYYEDVRELSGLLETFNETKQEEWRSLVKICHQEQELTRFIEEQDLPRCDISFVAERFRKPRRARQPRDNGHGSVDPGPGREVGVAGLAKDEPEQITRLHKEVQAQLLKRRTPAQRRDRSGAKFGEHPSVWGPEHEVMFKEFRRHYKGHALSAHDVFSRFVLSPEFTAFERSRAEEERRRRDDSITPSRTTKVSAARKRQDLNEAAMQTAELTLAMGILRRHDALVESLAQLRTDFLSDRSNAQRKASELMQRTQREHDALAFRRASFRRDVSSTRSHLKNLMSRAALNEKAGVAGSKPSARGTTRKLENGKARGAMPRGTAVSGNTLAEGSPNGGLVSNAFLDRENCGSCRSPVPQTLTEYIKWRHFANTQMDSKRSIEALKQAQLAARGGTIVVPEAIDEEAVAAKEAMAAVIGATVRRRGAPLELAVHVEGVGGGPKAGRAAARRDRSARREAAALQMQRLLRGHCVRLYLWAWRSFDSFITSEFLSSRGRGAPRGLVKTESLEELLADVGCDTLSFEDLEAIQATLDPNCVGTVKHGAFMQWWVVNRPKCTTLSTMMRDVRYARALRGKGTAGTGYMSTMAACIVASKVFRGYIARRYWHALASLSRSIEAHFGESSISPVLRVANFLRLLGKASSVEEGITLAESLDTSHNGFVTLDAFHSYWRQNYPSATRIRAQLAIVRLATRVEERGRLKSYYGDDVS